MENPKPHGKSYNKWLGDQAKPSHRELLRVAMDNALSQSPTDFEALLKLLQESGCEVSKRGKSYRLKLPGWEKAARMDSLGEGYGLDDLQAVLSGKNMRKKFCSTRRQRMPLMRWASRSCPRSKSCRPSTRNCWKKRKRPRPAVSWSKGFAERAATE